MPRLFLSRDIEDGNGRAGWRGFAIDMELNTGDSVLFEYVGMVGVSFDDQVIMRRARH
jgi:hypothetical protein